VQAAVKSKMILQNKIEQAFKMIDSTLRSDNFLQIKDKVKIEISFDEFYENIDDAILTFSEMKV
jgi:hypothetical protein